MQVRDVMTREVVTVGPDTSTKYAAEVMAEHGYAALPVVDGNDRLVGIVAEADVLRDRLPADPRLHLRRDGPADPTPPLLVRGVMTRGVRTVDAGGDVSDVARLFVDDRLRSVPVLEDGRLAGIVSRRDLLRALVRPDDEIRRDLLRLIEGYTGDLGDWEVTVVEGIATVRRTAGTPEPSAAVEQRALHALARTVPGVVGAQVLPGDADGHRGAPVDVNASS
ncbi:CBS domain-containing protein [Blastococcus sp. VKM Ac-2987]|uniref:CBS domain-containing protein n=1 Tax=Blastococcus sp. VKM Ac-2987 TaxID=3004141 RepID=UPI0022AB9C4D|nr:CBS domain-containing protein [Blastococcus sp. VKM Ac-2987]MCZ2860598.1 CBS domain-containing protein [Blastococcus sp. VKM Ac-2987]